MIFRKQITDIELVDKIRTSKKIEKYFSIFYDRHNRKVFNLCQYLLYNKDYVEDIFQETFISFYNNISIQKKKPENPVGYLMNTARNLCLKANRDNRNHQQIDTIDPALYANSYENNELFEIVLEKIELMSLKYKEVFILKELQGYSHKQISDICKISVATSKVRLYRAHAKLQEIMRPYIEEIKYYE